MCPFSNLSETGEHNFILLQSTKNASIASNVISFETVSAVVAHRY